MTEQPRTLSEDQYVCAVVIDFSDGGASEAQIMHMGALEDCFRVKAMLPALAYAGSRPDPKAFAVVIPKARWDADTIPMEAT